MLPAAVRPAAGEELRPLQLNRTVEEYLKEGYGRPVAGESREEALKVRATSRARGSGHCGGQLRPERARRIGSRTQPEAPTAAAPALPRSRAPPAQASFRRTVGLLMREVQQCLALPSAAVEYIIRKLQAQHAADFKDALLEQVGGVGCCSSGRCGGHSSAARLWLQCMQPAGCSRLGAWLGTKRPRAAATRFPPPRPCTAGPCRCPLPLPSPFPADAAGD